ncbi:CBS domain-containing protein [Actinomadura cellulosilytica]|uniref:CBS domain-containing protein n=1 Tax=Thermomonospora cellulosilytica TaxID=1411118 RepID=A0A7W3MVU1_9ACTN|nr:CBS domain-containing protein [Thermomonospora cellulosilytica]
MLRLLTERRIRGVPVVDERRKVVGIVTESDLLFKEEYHDPAGTAVPPDDAGHRGERAKAASATARGLMSTPAIAVTADVPVARAARLITEYRIGQLPVTDPNGRLVGIVARSDLLRVFLRPDKEIHDEVVHEALAYSLWRSPGEVEVRVHDGVVGLYGRVQARSLIPIAVRLVRSVEGVVDVVEELDYERDDVSPTLSPD